MSVSSWMAHEKKVSSNYQFRTLQCCNCQANYIKPKSNQAIWQSKYWIGTIIRLTYFCYSFFYFIFFFSLWSSNFSVSVAQCHGRYKFAINSEIRLNWSNAWKVFLISSRKMVNTNKSCISWRSHNVLFCLATIDIEKNQMSRHKTRNNYTLEWFSMCSISITLYVFTSSIWLNLCGAQYVYERIISTIMHDANPHFEWYQ